MKVTQSTGGVKNRRTTKFRLIVSDGDSYFDDMESQIESVPILSYNILSQPQYITLGLNENRSESSDRTGKGIFVSQLKSISYRTREPEHSSILRSWYHQNGRSLNAEIFQASAQMAEPVNDPILEDSVQRRYHWHIHQRYERVGKTSGTRPKEIGLRAIRPLESHQVHQQGNSRRPPPVLLVKVASPNALQQMRRTSKYIFRSRLPVGNRVSP